MTQHSIRTALVTGGLGYIGAHMVQYLTNKGIQCVIVDANIYGKPNRVSGTICYEQDIRHTQGLIEIFQNHRIEAIFHFAGLIQVGESVRHPLDYYDVNLSGTISLLKAMMTKGRVPFIFSSTAAVYGNPTIPTISETHTTLPLNPYGVSKLMVESILADMHRAYGLPYGILRYFNAAGADPSSQIGEQHEPETHLIPLLLQVATNRRPHIDVFGTNYPTHDGTCIRDYIHVVDLCEAHYLLLEYMLKGGEDHIFNLGTGHGYSVKEVIEAVEQVTNKTITTRLVNPREGDAAILIANGSKARKILGWKPVMSELTTIIEHALRWESLRLGVEV